MNLDEWYLNYERLMTRFVLEMHELVKEFANLTDKPPPPDSPDGIVASTQTPDVAGQERLDLTPRLDEVG